MSVQPSTFPTEVFEFVIACVPQLPISWRLRNRTLYNCALTCRAWTPTSRIHLYHTIYFYQAGRGLEQTLHLLERTLVAHPNLSQFIKAVQIVHPAWSLVPVPCALQNVGVLLCGKVPNLESLSFHGAPPPTNRGRILYPSRLTLHRSFFAAVTTFRELVALELVHTVFPTLGHLLRLLSGLLSLRSLAMFTVEVHGPLVADHLERIVRRLPSITCLAVGDAYDMWTGDGVPKLSWAMIRLFAPWLVSLTVSPTNDNWEKAIDDDAEVIHLSRLRFLTTSFSACDPHVRRGTFLATLVRHATTPVLNHLVYDDVITLDSFLDLSRLSPLPIPDPEAQLVLQALRHVHLIIRISHALDFNEEVFREHVSTLFSAMETETRRAYPRLLEVGFFRVTFKDIICASGENDLGVEDPQKSSVPFEPVTASKQVS